MKLRETLERLSGRVDDSGEVLGERRELTRQRIVLSASAAFVARGYREVRTGEVARAASVTRATLYAYFESKAHLLFAALAEETLEQLRTFAPLFDDELASEARLREWVRLSITYIEHAPLHARLGRDQDPDVMRTLTEHELARDALSLQPDLDKTRLFVALIGDAFPHVDDERAREVASLIRALGHMAPALAIEHARFGLSVDRVGALLAELLVDGLSLRKGRTS